MSIAQTAFQLGEMPAPTNASVFTGNMELPIHRWFRYSAGFSALWVESELQRRLAEGRHMRVLDPFAGSATTLIAAQGVGVESMGVESHPLVGRVARAKLKWEASADELRKRAAKVIEAARPHQRRDGDLPALLAKVFPSETLARLDGLRIALRQQAEGDETDELLWLGLLAILRRCSPVGTAQWQYVLPNKRKSRVAEPISAFREQVEIMVSDMRAMQRDAVGASAELSIEDARGCPSVPDEWATLVVTSPPYPNNYDYADATRIELTFLGAIERWGDLQEGVRSKLIRSCSQHMVRYDAEEDLNGELLRPIIKELRCVYEELQHVREHRGGRKAYHSMVVAYFTDLARCWRALRRACRSDAEVLFVVGDSAPYGVYVPVDRWLGELALAAGFESFDFLKLRDRNVKWKNRKHRVPLHEGILRVR